MKKTLAILLAAVLLAVLCAAGCAETENTITVTGSAAVSLAADYAELQLGVNTRRDTMQEAQQENAAVMAAVLAALKDMGIQDKDVMTSQFNVFCGTDYTMQPDGKQAERRYYSVDNILRVVIHDLSAAGKVLDAAITAGANQCYGITFASTQENEAYHKALTRAYEDAQKKAQTLAQAAGKKLGDVVAMDARQGGYEYGIRNDFMAKEAAMGTSIVSGNITVNAGVSVTWRFD